MLPLDKVVELVYTLVILLFLAAIVLAILIAITILQELALFDIDFKFRVVFILGMFATFVYITKLIVDKIREYNRYI
ncbi:MAG: hypothetical protein WCS88_03365 [Patescibacteria group bacterium]|jgi:hypothetical protein